MKQEVFLGMNCMVTAFPQGAFSYESLHLMEYTGTRADIGRMSKNGSFDILTEREWVTEGLKQGKGIVSKGYVFFLNEKIEESEYYFRFKKALNQFLNRLSKTELFLYEALFDSYHFYLVKSMITLYHKDLFTHEQMMIKLETYMPKTKVLMLLNHVSPNRVAV